MAAKKTSPESMDLIVSTLRKEEQGRALRDVRARAEQRGLTVYPIMYARGEGGLVPMAARGQAKAVEGGGQAGCLPAGATLRPGGDRGVHARPPSFVDSIATVIGALQEGGRERDRYGRALEQIRVAGDRAARDVGVPSPRGSLDPLAKLPRVLGGAPVSGYASPAMSASPGLHP